ncbi:MAG: 8-oxo-dGTP diphosphatase [Lachnospiraceae bacterium]|nr:8-oxo-dGTP diphosphatase [Lachnospiraceae bacterium]MCR5739443.1 8-oxo-dGTP diphosphatase [Lachnospiraceae bacterium]
MRRSTLCYIEKDGKVLLLYRNKKENDPNEGKWIGVGGKIEEGETPDTCVIREVMEETGLKLTDYRQCGKVKFISEAWEDEEMYLYSAEGFEGEISRDCDEGDLKWIDKDKVSDLPMWEGDRYFLKEMTDGNHDIDMTLVYKGTGEHEHLYEVIRNK